MSEFGTLFVCATPIGNLSDVTKRLEETLRAVDIVYAEDTRRTGKLLAHLGIDVPTRSLFAGNEAVRTGELVSQVVDGRSVALVSDAGMPTVSDPGAAAVAEVRRAGGHVTVIPGPSAATSAVALSGFPGDRFVFEGFLPRKGDERWGRIAELRDDTRPIVLFASPHRFLADLSDLAEALGEDREVTVCRELTKMHEEVWSGSLAGAIDRWTAEEPKGEFTLVLSPSLRHEPDLAMAVSEARGLVESGVSVSDAARTVASRSGVSRREVYEALVAGQAVN